MKCWVWLSQGALECASSTTPDKWLFSSCYSPHGVLCAMHVCMLLVHSVYPSAYCISCCFTHQFRWRKLVDLVEA